MKRKQPAAQCRNCGRTVAFAAGSAVVYKAVFNEVYPRAVNTLALRRHKCEHGAWCEDCSKKHEALKK